MPRPLPASRALALVAGALALVVTAFAGTAGATVPARDGVIHQTLPISADTFTQDPDCGSISEGTAWHFILNNTTGDPAGAVLTATFEDAGPVQATVAEVTGGAAHFYVATGDDDVLTAASVDPADGQLQLSHVCDAPDAGDEDDEEIPALCPDGETEITDETDLDEDGTADMCQSGEPARCPDGETDITDDTDADENLVADMCESDGPVTTTIELECIDDEVVVTVTGQDLSNITFYDAEDGVRGGQDTIFTYSEDGDAPLPTPTVDEDGAEVFVVSIPEGAVRVSAKAALVEEYSDLDCSVEVIDDEIEGEADCPKGMVPPAAGELLDADEDGEAENCTSVLGGEVVTGTPVETPVTPTAGETPTTPEAPTPEAEVEGDAVVPATPAIPTVQPTITAQPTVLDQAPAVMGDVVTRSGQLPRTGPDAAGALVPFGLALLAAGFALHRTGSRAVRQSA